MNQHPTKSSEAPPKADAEAEANWGFPDMEQDDQSITRDWTLVNQDLIEGVIVKEITNVYTGYGHLTEIFRMDWQLDEFGVDQVFQGTFRPGGLSAWHAHSVTTDRLFVSSGTMKVALYDARQDSPTFGKLNVFRAGIQKPAMIIVPPKVWHGVQNIGLHEAVLINAVDHAYKYEGPDHYRIPHPSPNIPFVFETELSG